MKARIKKTGKIINLASYGDEVENAVIFADKLISKLKEKEDK